jgi:hypothetical protein
MYPIQRFFRYSISTVADVGFSMNNMSSTLSNGFWNLFIVVLGLPAHLPTNTKLCYFAAKNITISTITTYDGENNCCMQITLCVYKMMSFLKRNVQTSIIWLPNIMLIDLNYLSNFSLISILKKIHKVYVQEFYWFENLKSLCNTSFQLYSYLQILCRSSLLKIRKVLFT